MSLIDYPRTILLEPLIRRWPAKFLRLEVGPYKGLLGDPIVKFDVKFLELRFALVAILRLVNGYVYEAWISAPCLGF